MPVLSRLILSLTFLFASIAVHAQDINAVNAATKQTMQAEADLRVVDRALDTRVDADARAALRSQATAAQQALRDARSQLEQQLAFADARIAGLGPVTEGVAEAPDIQRQRQRLGKSRAAIDGAAKRANLADVEAQQLIDEIDRSQAEQLGDQLSERVHSPLSPDFWGTMFKALPRDLRRVNLFVSQGTAQIRETWRGGLPWQAVLGLLVAFGIMFPLRVASRDLGRRYLIGSAPGHRIRRSVFALWRVVVGTLSPLLAALAIAQGFRWAGLFPDRWDAVLNECVGAAGFAGLTSSLAGAILMRGQSSWRIAPIGDDTAQRLRPLTWVLSGIAFVSIVLTAFNSTVVVSRAAQATWQMIDALVHLLWIGAFLLLIARLRSQHNEAQEPSPSGAGVALITLVTWSVVLFALVALACGYVSLSLFVAQIIIWAGVLAAGLYLLLGTADDAATMLFNRESRLGITLTRSIGVRGSVVDQFGVLISGAIRLFLILTAAGLLMTPFGGGNGLGSLFGRVGTFAQGIEIGGVTIAPGAIIRAVVVLAVGLSLARAFMRWVDKRYLPATDLDGSARNSASLVARYVGIALAIIWALASLGIGVERIALLLSALSVGIGFGLQAITQNFVSGLILLAERPIKIGDWVRVGADEGDVKRISVRSTEITLADHSTLIVPNSELITKSVLNKTLSSPLGRIQIQFSVLIETDADQVRRIVLAAFDEEAAILDDPAPSAFVDSIADGRIMFNCFAHVGSPRDVYSARSRVFFALLRDFANADIDIGTVPQRLQLTTEDRSTLESGVQPQPDA